MAAAAVPETEEVPEEADDEGMLDAMTDCDPVEDEDDDDEAAIVLLPSSVRESKFDNGNVIFASTRTTLPLLPTEDDEESKDENEEEDLTARNQNAIVCRNSKNFIDTVRPRRLLRRPPRRWMRQ